MLFPNRAIAQRTAYGLHLESVIHLQGLKLDKGATTRARLPIHNPAFFTSPQFFTALSLSVGPIQQTNGGINDSIGG